MLDDLTARQSLEAHANTLPEYPGGHEGRGIVIPGGGLRYFPCAYVNVRMLRRLGCMIPIELWHLGPAEMTADMQSLLAPHGVRCIDALEVRRRHPVRTLRGWELKPYAILHSSFAEVILLDADNVPVVDPAFLFDTPQYRRTGAIFWPDYGRLQPADPIWRLTGIEYRDEPEFESGQAVIDKWRCWKPLLLAMWMNEQSDYWYTHMLGDKETFHLAWRKLGIEYAMPPFPIHPLPCVMCQHDFNGRRIFQHRNLAKWQVCGNQRIEGFLLEEQCLGYLEELRDRWEPLAHVVGHLSPEDSARMDELAGQRFNYVRVGYDQRPMRLDAGGLISEGAGGCEMLWCRQNGRLLLIAADGSLTCTLEESSPGCWIGRWLVHEKMPIRLEYLAKTI